MRKIIPRRMMEDGCKIPRGFRVAYWEFDTASYILYPIGIHWVVSLFHYLHKISYYHIRPTKVELALRKAYNDGQKAGRDSERLYWERNIDEIIKQRVTDATLNLADTVLKTISDSIEEESK